MNFKKTHTFSDRLKKPQFWRRKRRLDIKASSSLPFPSLPFPSLPSFLHSFLEVLLEGHKEAEDRILDLSMAEGTSVIQKLQTSKDTTPQPA
jgi:hypothetical protein